VGGGEIGMVEGGRERRFLTVLVKWTDWKIQLARGI
jgi:hypothetical protein